MNAIGLEFSEGLQLTRDMVALSMAAVPRFKGPIAIPGINLQFNPLRSSMDLDALRSEFARWAITSGFREHAESQTFFLTRVNATLARWTAFHSMPGSRLIASDDFREWNLPTKLQSLASAYGIRLEGALCDSVRQVYKIRNCLVHRGGVVTAKDANHAEGMQLIYRSVSATIVESSGRVVPLGRALRDGDRFHIQDDWARRLWKLGERVQFTAQEFADVTHTINMFGKWTARAMLHTAWRSGIVSEEPPPMDAPYFSLGS